MSTRRRNSCIHTLIQIFGFLQSLPPLRRFYNRISFPAPLLGDIDKQIVILGADEERPLYTLVIIDMSNPIDSTDDSLTRCVHDFLFKAGIQSTFTLSDAARFCREHFIVESLELWLNDTIEPFAYEEPSDFDVTRACQRDILPIQIPPDVPPITRPRIPLPHYIARKLRQHRFGSVWPIRLVIGAMLATFVGMAVFFFLRYTRTNRFVFTRRDGDTVQELHERIDKEARVLLDNRMMGVERYPLLITEDDLAKEEWPVSEFESGVQKGDYARR